MKLILQQAFLIVFLFAFLSLTGQRPPGASQNGPKGIKIIGLLQDINNKVPLEFAAISLLKLQDSTLVTGAITDIDGRFEMDAKPGQYFVKLEYISYQTEWINEVSVNPDNGPIDLGIIFLDANTQMLDEIEVRAEKSTLQMGLDKKVFNVGKDLANRGMNAANVLDNIPSVTVDIEGNVELRGSGNVRILVDGKPSGLIGIGNSNGLQSLQGNMIDRVEIVTNPSAKYDAEGMSGIINIILKKNTADGFNGSFDASLGSPELFGVGANVNYRKSNVNIFGQYGFNQNGAPGGGNLKQEIFLEDNERRFVEQNQVRNRSRQSHTVRAGADFFLDEQNIITASGMFRYTNSDNNSITTYEDLNNERELFSTTIRTEDEIEKEPNLEGQIDYRRTFKKKGRKLNLGIRYRDGSEDENSVYDEKQYLPNEILSGEFKQRSNNQEGETTTIINADFEEPIGEKGKFEFGYRGNLGNINNNYLVEELIDANWERVDGQSNNFIYGEKIHAIYSTIGNKFNKFSIQGGLRWELSDIDTYLADTDERNDRNYNNLFPSAHVGYELKNQNSVQVSYSRRIRRPGFRYLNPFFSFADSRNIFRGNPNLDPTFTDSYEIGHIKYWDETSISSSIYYRHSTGEIERILTINDDGTTFRQPENLNTSNSVGIEFTFNSKLVKWWDLNGSANFYREVTDGSNIMPGLQATATSMTTRLTNKWKVGDKIEVQSRFNYRAPQKTTQGSRRSMTFADLAIAWDVLKGKGTVNFSISDLFNSRKYRYSYETEKSIQEGDFQWRSRQYTLSMNYRINQKKKRERGERGGFDGGDMEGF